MIKECYNCENCRRTLNEFGVADGYCCKLMPGEDFSYQEDLFNNCPLKELKMINKEELINYFKELEESYENAALPSWMSFQDIIEHIEIFPEH